ncbi:cysteine desulfurase family protein [Metabacillus idriensis]|uniref:cysteine desulfurase family protein n=1 Tax=Metabacillus idriensis TaxID=324768 RepID=UPI001747F0C7|nr:cysteine desulfurase family protein [Metabacillus idriensis]
MIYLDNSATTRTYEEVLHSFTHVATRYFANPSSLHGLGAEAENLLTQARKQIAELLGAEAEEIIFTSGGTEGNNLAIKGTALALKNKGKHIITTQIEHPSVIESCRQLQELFDFEITYLPVNEEGIVSIKDVEKHIRKDTILVSIMHVNNETGSIQPIEEIGNLLRMFPGIYFHVDDVQGVTKVPLSLENIDLCSISGHKFHALNGCGALFVRKGTRVKPLLTGGLQEMQARSGTESIALAVSMAKALRMSIEKYDICKDDLRKMKNKTIHELTKMNEIVVNTPEQSSAPHILNFSAPGFQSEVLVHMLEQSGVFVSTTSACSSKRKRISNVLLAMGKGDAIASSSLRISLSYENTEHELKVFIDVLKKSLGKLMKVTR